MLRVVLSFSCLVFAFSAPHFGGEVFQNLTADQKQQLESLKEEIKANVALTKAQIKEKFDALFQKFGITVILRKNFR